MARPQRALSDAPGGAESVAERPPRSRGVMLLGFAAALVLALAFLFTALRKRPANVPNGLLGLRFGMTETEARAELPAFAPGASGKLEAKTRVFEAPARCTLGFSESELTSIECNVEPLTSLDEHHRLKQRIVATARQLYGEESDARGGERERWSWRSSYAELSVTSDPGRALVVHNVRHRR